jgi:arylsulfatase A-like enzyme
MKKIVSVSLIALVFGGIGNALAENEKASRPNILFFAFDDLRPLIGAYGEPEPITPNLDALAKDGVRFDRNYVAYPLCNPSRATMLTGIRFDNRPVTGWKPMSHQEMIGRQATWPRVLREAGYWTAARGKVYHSSVPNADKSAWDIAGGKGGANAKKIVSAVVETGGREEHIEKYLETGSGPAALAYFSVDGPDNLLNDGQTCDDVISYIKEKRDPEKPFAIACGFLRPHMPWAAPKKYFDMYPNDAGELAYLPEGAEKSVDEEEISPKNKNEVWNEGVDDVTASKLIRGYMACTSYVDAQMGKVIQALKEEGLYENTIIVAWGDHGYHLTDHGLWRKNTAYHISMRSPLLIKAPGVAGGQTVNQVVGNVDLYPTLLELTGVEKPDSVVYHGKSLVPLLKNPTAEWDNITYTCAKGRYGLITDQYRFTVSENGASLYDLENDPHEWNNLGKSPEYADLIQEFEAKLAMVAWNTPTGESVKTDEPKPTKAKPVETAGAKEWDFFGALDKNKDGAVTEEEWLKRAQSTANKKGKPYDEAQVKKNFARHDSNGDGAISRAELEKGG